MFFLLDVASLIMGVMLIVAPGWVYNLGKQPHEKKEISTKAKWGFTIFGVVVVIASGLFLYFDLTGG